MIRQNRTRWILIFGLLAGLFFSGGEGIQLMPFPVSENARSTLNVSVHENQSKSYAFSIFNSRAFSASLKAKFQKDSNQSLTGERLSFEPAASGANFCPNFIQRYRASSLQRSSPIFDSQSNRAPPVI